MYPLDLSSSHALPASIGGTAQKQPTVFTFDTKTSEGRKSAEIIQTEEIVRMKKLCIFLKASIEHERHVVKQYVTRLHERELHHADTIDCMHLGENGVVVLEKKLFSSNSVVGELETKVNDKNK